MKGQIFGGYYRKVQQKHSPLHEAPASALDSGNNLPTTLSLQLDK